MQLLIRVYLFFIRYTLDLFFKLIPVQAWPYFNSFLFRIKGYNVSLSARLYSTVQITGIMNVTIGSDTFIGHESRIVGGGQASIIIGENCDISDRVSIFCGTHDIDLVGIRVAGIGIGKNVEIGDGVWIGYGALILPGVKIGNKAIIAAGAVVHKNVDEGTIVGGNPIKIIRKIYDR